MTAEPSEGEAFTENATDLVEAVPMPEPVARSLPRSSPSTTSEHPFVKRQRDRADPEVMARRRLAKIANEQAGKFGEELFAAMVAAQAAAVAHAPSGTSPQLRHL